MMLHVMFWEMSLIQYEICRSLVKQWIHQSHQTAVTSVGRGLHLLCILVHCIDLSIYVRILCSYCLSTTVVVNSLMLPLLWWQLGHRAEVNSIHILHIRWCQRVYLSHIGFRICWRKLHQCTIIQCKSLSCQPRVCGIKATADVVGSCHAREFPSNWRPIWLRPWRRTFLLCWG